MESACFQCGKAFDASVVANRFAGVCPSCLAKFAADDSGDVAPSPGAADPRVKPPLKLGGTFHGLEVVELLGAGGMGVVYKARQPGLDRFVALKILSPQLSSDPEFVARFNREAKAMAALSHPGIVQIFDFGKEADLCFLVMEYVDGLSLRHLMKDRLLAPEQALKVVPMICEALDFAHSKGVIHRDIKPENILIDKEGRVRIADFGLARMVSGAPGAPSATLSRVVMGTPGYMAPEQYQGMNVDHRADIYSLGAVFYEMLTGEVPMGRFDLPSSKVQVDVRLDEIVLKALATEPARRYQRAGDVKTAVETVAFRPLPAVADSPTVVAGPYPGRQLVRWLLMIPLVLITLGLLLFGVLVMRSGGIPEIVIVVVLLGVVLLTFRKIEVLSGAWARGSPVAKPSPTPLAPGAPEPRISKLAISAFIWTMVGTALLAASFVVPAFMRVHG